MSASRVMDHAGRHRKVLRREQPRSGAHGRQV